MLFCPCELTLNWTFSKGQNLIADLSLLTAAGVTAIMTYLLQAHVILTQNLHVWRSVKSFKKAIVIAKKKHTKTGMLTKPASYCRII